ncbi:putative ABC transport system permease protein [Lacibacter cauensis]|uniref:Putative ABC transport system permease protein n=1 Tax=Lacibacter cauensis TaxID=510947 RepID=A0A562SVE6_9BACT|nr:ABC transporter permease [Lacibacter cauensis]TWI85231.1 putative ABC transport system permease protein [Lacibacter cauensis]
MRKTFEIFWNSLLFATQELRKNKLRTFLSLLGITFGIFCIISVMATVGSLESSIKNEFKSFGNNTIYVQKWPWGGGGEYPWWKYISRPNAKFKEMAPVKQRMSLAGNVAYTYFNASAIDYKDVSLSSVNWYGVTEEFNEIQPVEMGTGRYLSNNEFAYGTASVVMGYNVAEKLFDKAEYAVGKTVDIKGRKVNVVGVIKKQGQNLLGGWDFDNVIIIPYRFASQVGNEARSDGFILVKGKENVPVEDLKNELRGVMRSIRKLNPKQEDNFALNDVSTGATQITSIFDGMTIGGIAITILSFIVGIFGVANIMFVTVRERTSIIGLKKAIGAKRRTILAEFLMESAFLCILGGIIGLAMVFGLTFALSAAFKFKVFISIGLFLGAVMVCIITGILAGIIPAFIAAKMDPVVAIRSK